MTFSCLPIKKLVPLWRTESLALWRILGLLKNPHVSSCADKQSPYLIISPCLIRSHSFRKISASCCFSSFVPSFCPRFRDGSSDRRICKLAAQYGAQNGMTRAPAPSRRTSQTWKLAKNAGMKWGGFHGDTPTLDLLISWKK